MKETPIGSFADRLTCPFHTAGCSETNRLALVQCVRVSKDLDGAGISPALAKSKEHL